MKDEPMDEGDSRAHFGPPYTKVQWGLLLKKAAVLKQAHQRENLTILSLAKMKCQNDAFFSVRH